MGINRRHLALFVAATFAIYAFTSVYYLLPSYLEGEGRSSASVGLLVSAYYVVVSLVRPFGGWMTERLGVRKTLLLAGLTAASGGFLLAAATATPLVLAARMITGLGFSCYCVALTSLQSLVTSDSSRGATFAITSLGSIGPLFLVIPLADALLHRGWNLAYLLEAPLMALAATVLALFLPDIDNESDRLRPAWGSYGELFALPDVKILLLSAFAFAVTDSAIVYVANLAATKGLTASPFIAVSGLASLGTRLLFRRHMDSVPRRKLAGPSFGVMALALLLASSAARSATLIGAGLLFGIGLGFAFPVHLALVGDLTSPGLRPKGTAMIYLAQDLSWVMLPLFVGFSSPLLGLKGAFRALAGFSLAASIILTVLWNRPSRRARR